MVLKVFEQIDKRLESVGKQVNSGAQRQVISIQTIMEIADYGRCERRRTPKPV